MQQTEQVKGLLVVKPDVTLGFPKTGNWQMTLCQTLPLLLLWGMRQRIRRGGLPCLFLIFYPC